MTETDYAIDDLRRDGERILPGKRYEAVCFGHPGPAAEVVKSNSYVAEAGREDWVYPLMLAGGRRVPQDKIIEELKRGFFGYKVQIPWLGNDYGDVLVGDMIGSEEMEIAETYSLIVLLHIPRAERLAHPEVQRGVRELARSYPSARIVLAHCGRCYLPDQMKAGLLAISDIDNLYLDTAMVMEPLVFEMLLDTIDSSRLLFGTDLPVASMRGRRVYVMDHWVDLVLEGYPESGYRVQSSAIRATFMVYEIVLAIRRASERVGLTEEKFRAIFYENGVSLLNSVRRPT